MLKLLGLIFILLLLLAVVCVVILHLDSAEYDEYDEMKIKDYERSHEQTESRTTGEKDSEGSSAC